MIRKVFTAWMLIGPFFEATARARAYFHSISWYDENEISQQQGRVPWSAARPKRRSRSVLEALEANRLVQTVEGYQQTGR